MAVFGGICLEPKVCCCKHCDDISCEDNPEHFRYDPDECPKCHGLGYWRGWVDLPKKHWYSLTKREYQKIKCSFCNGTGKWKIG